MAQAMVNLQWYQDPNRNMKFLPEERLFLAMEWERRVITGRKFCGHLC